MRLRHAFQIALALAAAARSTAAQPQPASPQAPRNVVVRPWLPDNAATRAELAEYYQSVSRVDQGVGRLVRVLKAAGVYDHTLILYLSDYGGVPGRQDVDVRAGAARAANR